MNQGIEDEDRIASAILRDLPEVLGLARPHATRAPFEWLDPAYGDDVYSPPVERLVNAWRAAEESIQVKTCNGLLLAIDRAATTWLGAERTLALLDWAYEITPESIPASRWIAMLFHRNPVDAAETAYWVRQIVERFSRWQLNLHALLPLADGIPDYEWGRLVVSTYERDRVDVAIWLLELLRPRHEKSLAVWNAVVKTWKSKLPDLPEGYEDWYVDIVDPLSEAANHPEFVLEAYEDTSSSRRHALACYVGDAEDWPLAA